MNKRVERLDVVQQVTSRHERERAERLAEAERNAIEAEQKLVALERDEPLDRAIALGLATAAASVETAKAGAIDPSRV